MDQNGWFRLEAGRQKRNGSPPNRPKPPEQPVRPKVTSLPLVPAQEAAPVPIPEPEPLVPAPVCLPEPEPPKLSRPAKPTEAPTPPMRNDLASSQTVGNRGPVLWQDSMLHETLAFFVHGAPLPRVVHTKGFGAFGSFCPYQSMADCTALSFLQSPDQPTPVTVRFSPAVSSRGTPDTARNVWGLSAKFFAPDGVFDLLCNHIPVFLVRDAMRFPAAIRALQPSPASGLTDPNLLWSFAAGAPEATHFLTWLFSDTGTIKNLRQLRYYGVNTYVWTDRAGRRRLVKYHWIPLAGEACLIAPEAVRLAGEDPDAAGQDLFRTIAVGTPVEFELRVQLMDPQMADSLSYDPLDCTKVWSETDFPLQPVGRLVLSRNPEDYAAQVESLAFSPANLLPGAELSDDKLLQGRANLYWDAQRLRLGPNFRALPANRQEGWTPRSLVTSGQDAEVCGRLVRTPTPLGDDFAQAGDRFRSLSPEEQEHLAANLAASLTPIREDLRRTVLGYFREADPELARMVEVACGH